MYVVLNALRVELTDHSPSKELVVALDDKLEGTMQDAFSKVLDPRLVAIFQANLHPLQTELESLERTRDEQHQMIIETLRQQYAATEPVLRNIPLHRIIMEENFKTVISSLEEHKAHFAEEFEELRNGHSASAPGPPMGSLSSQISRSKGVSYTNETIRVRNSMRNDDPSYRESLRELWEPTCFRK